jgi:hypothetical protein
LKWSERRERRFAIPRANILANIATDYGVTEGRAQIFWNRGAQFDGEVRNAAAGIENIRRGESLGWARVETERAGAAAVGRGRFVRLERGSKFERSDDDAEKKPGAQVLVDQASIFREPTEPGIFCCDAFDDRAGIDVGPGVEGLRPLGVH